MNKIAISAMHITKSFKLYSDKPMTIKERLLHLRSKNYSEYKALDDISFDIYDGESVALVGVNGSGKSTLLKIISKIISPNAGTIVVNGKVAGLLELGAGFHPDFTGRENIYINASILGLNKKEIDNILEKIIEFSELSEYIDSPIRTYSSGMYMRLAFAIAINVDADILLIDEILAVGDARFQHKCYKKLDELKNAGKTIVLVTHDSDAVKRTCDRTIWIKDHKIFRDDKTINIIEEFRKSTL